MRWFWRRKPSKRNVPTATVGSALVVVETPHQVAAPLTHCDGQWPITEEEYNNRLLELRQRFLDLVKTVDTGKWVLKYTHRICLAGIVREQYAVLVCVANGQIRATGRSNRVVGRVFALNTQEPLDVRTRHLDGRSKTNGQLDIQKLLTEIGAAFDQFKPADLRQLRLWLGKIG